MDRPSESVPTTEGYLVVGDDGIRIEADLEQFLEGQTARLEGGDGPDRLVVLLKYLVPLALFLAAAVVYDPTAVGAVLVAGAFALGGLGLLGYHVRLADVEIDHDAVESVDLDLGERTLKLEYSDYRPRRWATPDQSAYYTTLRFHSDEVAERARAVLAESPLGDRLEVTEADDESVETDHRVDVEDGVLFCESCGTQVSPSDERCPSCDYGLWPDTAPESPSGASDDDDRTEVVETDHRVDVEDGVVFCESCGSQVSPTDRRCPSCDYRIWAERGSPDSDLFTVDAPEPETETVYRVETEKGVPFCENCGTKVSPTDDACRSCDYALRVERAVVTEEEES